MKNIKHLCGTPLVEWILRAAMNANCIDSVILSSDSEAILDVGRDLGCDIHVRNACDAEDTTSSEQSLIAVLKEHPLAKNAATILMVQPTSPFTTSADFDSALKMFVEGEFDSMVTAVKHHDFHWQIEEDGTATPAYDPHKRPFRQQMHGQRRENGAFYITSRELLDSTACRLGGRIGCHTMAAHNGIEIDEKLDWVMIEMLAKKLGLTPEPLA
jgi:N-acylneuraminate cytidylyltransferase